MRSGLSEAGADPHFRDRNTRLHAGDHPVDAGDAVDQGGGAGVVQRIDRQHRGVASRIALHANRMHRDGRFHPAWAAEARPIPSRDSVWPGRGGERMAVQQLGGEAQFAADFADLVLIKGLQRFTMRPDWMSA